jgi:hypothetical protein
MTAQTADRNTPRMQGDIKFMAMAASALIHGGSIVMRSATGYATKGATALGYRGAGMAMERVDNSAGAAGDLSISVREGTFRFANSAAGDAIVDDDMGKHCYIVDDQTVAKTNGANTRSVAGVVAGVDDQGVWVNFEEKSLAAYLATRRVFVPLRVGTLVGTGVYRQISVHAGRVVKIWSVIEGVLTTGDATLTPKINGTAITAGLLTITQAGSAAGDIDSAVPTGANVVAVGDELSALVGGNNATATVANLMFEIERD